ncbi:MAG: biotin/lipoate A/B protein ligase family protein [Gemmatimonadales bacterium]
MTSPFRFLVSQPQSGPANMATDLSLLDLADREGVAFLRLYRWAPSCLSFGRHEPALRRYDREAITERGLDTVRRPTGGRAVWHARELTYAVAAPIAQFGSMATAYRDIHEMLADAIRLLGGEATLAVAPARMGRLEAGACFAQPAGGEVLVRGHKVVGSAQLRQGEAFLQHGSLLLEDGQALVSELLRHTASPVAGCPLVELIGRAISFEEAADAVGEAAAGRWGAPVPTSSAVAEAIREGTDRHRALFESDRWTWRR